MWKTIQLIPGILGLALVFAGHQFSIPFLMNAGITCLGLTSMAIGWEAIFTQHIVIGRRRHGSRQTYTGLAAICQGIQFNVIGLFLIAAAFLLNQNMDARELGIQWARHPGLPLIAIGTICLIQSVISLIGPLDTREHSAAIELIGWISRLLPGVILVLLGVGMIGLGLFEIVAPQAFDQMGGAFLESLYSIK